jgi:hypothetical protein
MRSGGLGITAGMGLLGMIALQACGAMRSTQREDVSTMIARARTAADHEAIAAEYDRQAAEARKEAELHRRMAKSYATGASTGRVGLTPLPQHCAAIARRYERIAEEDVTLAATHREIAKAIK